MAQLVYIAAFIQDEVDDPLNAISTWFNEVPDEYSGHNFGVQGVVLSNIPITHEMMVEYVEGMLGPETYANDPGGATG